jgi:hypothetical protein
MNDELIGERERPLHRELKKYFWELQNLGDLKSLMIYIQGPHKTTGHF